MNIDPDKIKDLIIIFSELNEDRQKELMHKAVYLQFEQGQEDSLRKSKVDFNEKKLKEKTASQLKGAVQLMNMMKKFDKDQLASICMLMNELSCGQLSKEEEIEIYINSRQLSIEEFLEKRLPGADLVKAKQRLQEKVADGLAMEPEKAEVEQNHIEITR